MLIDGEAVAAATGDWIEVDNPANGAVISQVPKGSAADAEQRWKRRREPSRSGP